MTMQTIPLCAIELTDANPRTSFDAATIEGLAASIQTDGLLQNLVVMPSPDPGRYRLVSGERRYRALKLLAERGDIGADHAVAADIRTGLLAEDALRIATVENLQRESLSPLDEADALTHLVQDGERLDAIAAQTGLSERTIKRRLALNSLCDSACRALKNDAISLAQAEALTLGDEEAQCRILERIAEGYDYSADDIKDHLLDGKCPVSIAIFPRERYSGTYTRDLFADDATTYFDDVEQFFALQREAVGELAERHAERAAWVEVTEAYRLPAWQYREAASGEESGVVINLAPTGKVEVREGLLKYDIDTSAEEVAGELAPVKKAKPAYSAILCRYLAYHKSAAVQSLLLADRCSTAWRATSGRICASTGGRTRISSNAAPAASCWKLLRLAGFPPTTRRRRPSW
jgi:ParB/RepB/Spo0J family partition protein